jgi:hypothetical protein
MTEYMNFNRGCRKWHSNKKSYNFDDQYQKTIGFFILNFFVHYSITLAFLKLSVNLCGHKNCRKIIENIDFHDKNYIRFTNINTIHYNNEKKKFEKNTQCIGIVKR